MMSDIQNLINNYHSWLKDKTILRQIDDWVEISSPFLDRHNDYVQIYIKRDNGGYLLSDDGYTIEDLEQSGCKLESPKRQDLLKMTLNGFGVHLVEKSLQVNATAENFPLKKHNLIQAMLAVNDMFYLSVPIISNLFYEDVVTWLDINDIRYTPSVKFTGKTGFDHLFDFVIPKSRKRPERIVQTINRPNRDSVQSLLLSWFDTKEIRTAESCAYALLNDTESPVPASATEALSNYDVIAVPWSKREDYREALGE